MKKNEEIINSIRDILIEMNKGTVSNDNIIMYYDQHNQMFTEMDNTYHCMITLLIYLRIILFIKWENIVGGLVDKSKSHIDRSHQDDK